MRESVRRDADDDEGRTRGGWRVVVSTSPPRLAAMAGEQVGLERRHRS